MTKINLDKFYHDSKEKLITATNTLEGSAWEINHNPREIIRGEAVNSD